MKQTFYSNGKLLITGEYLVLDGAKAFALPTKFGQSLIVEQGKNNEIHWTSYDADGIIVGHVYYFLEDVYPLIADIRGWQVRRWLAAPVLLKQLFGEHIPAPMRGGVHAPPVMDDAGVGADVDGVGADVDGAGVDAAAGGANAQQNDPAGVPGREEEQGPAAVAAH